MLSERLRDLHEKHVLDTQRPMSIRDYISTIAKQMQEQLQSLPEKKKNRSNSKRKRDLKSLAKHEAPSQQLFALGDKKLADLRKELRS